MDENGIAGYVNIKLTFPMASRPRSKNNIIPRNRNNRPKPVTPMPISIKNENTLIGISNA